MEINKWLLDGGKWGKVLLLLMMLLSGYSPFSIVQLCVMGAFHSNKNTNTNVALTANMNGGVSE